LLQLLLGHVKDDVGAMVGDIGVSLERHRENVILCGDRKIGQLTPLTLEARKVNRHYLTSVRFIEIPDQIGTEAIAGFMVPKFKRKNQIHPSKRGHRNHQACNILDFYMPLTRLYYLVR